MRSAIKLVMVLECCESFNGNAWALPVPMPGAEDIPKMLADSTLVCKGEVTDAPAVKIVQDTRDLRRFQLFGKQ